MFRFRYFEMNMKIEFCNETRCERLYESRLKLQFKALEIIEVDKVDLESKALYSSTFKYNGKNLLTLGK
jgi:purine-nucleoside phosphorylase